MNWRRWLACVASGVLLAAAGPQWDLGWLVWVAFVPLLGSVSASPRVGFVQGWVTGAVAHALSFAWMVQTVADSSGLGIAGGVALWLGFTAFSAAQLGAMFGLAGWLRQRTRAWVVALAFVAVAVEQLFPQMFPYRLGHMVFQSPLAWQLASVLGPLGVSWLVVATSAALASRQVGAILGVVGLHVVNVGFGAWRHGRLEGELERAPVLTMGLVQQSATLAELKARPRLETIQTWDLRGVEADLVVLPEAAVRVNPWDEEPYEGLIRGGVEVSPRAWFEGLTAGDLLVGGGTYEWPEGVRRKVANTMTLFREGHPPARHDKQVLMPFGEYLPGTALFPDLPEWVGRPPDMRAGAGPTAFELSSGHRVATPICYAGMLPDAMRAFHALDVDLYAVVSNDSWFGDTAAPYQHAMVASGFAVALGRPVTLNALTGVSRVVEPHGDVVFEAPPFQDVLAVVPIRMGSTETIYAAGGWAFGWICVPISLLLVGVAGRRRPGAPADR